MRFINKLRNSMLLATTALVLTGSAREPQAYDGKDNYTTLNNAEFAQLYLNPKNLSYPYLALSGGLSGIFALAGISLVSARANRRLKTRLENTVATPNSKHDEIQIFQEPKRREIIRVDPTDNNGLTAPRSEMQRLEYRKRVFNLDDDLTNEYLKMAYFEIKSGKTDSFAGYSPNRFWLSNYVTEVTNDKYEVIYTGNEDNCHIRFRDKKTKRFVSKWSILDIFETKMRTEIAQKRGELSLAL